MKQLCWLDHHFPLRAMHSAIWSIYNKWTSEHHLVIIFDFSCYRWTGGHETWERVCDRLGMADYQSLSHPDLLTSTIVLLKFWQQFDHIYKKLWSGSQCGTYRVWCHIHIQLVCSLLWQCRFSTAQMDWVSTKLVEIVHYKKWVKLTSSHDFLNLTIFAGRHLGRHLE